MGLLLPQQSPIIHEILGHSTFNGWTHQAVKQEFEAAWCLGLVHLDQAQPLVGAFAFCRSQQDFSEITQLATHPQWRGQGLMLRLLTELLGRLSGPSFLEVHELNSPARKLYKKLGFARVGLRPNYYPNNHSAFIYRYR